VETGSGGPVEQDRSWRFGIGGDTVLTRRVERATLAAGNMTLAFGDMVPFLRELDLFFLNLEGQIADQGGREYKGLNRSMIFTPAKPQMVNALVESGVDVVTIANNHGMDYGPEALLQTIEICREAGLTIVGGGRNAAEAAAPGYASVGDRVILFAGLNSTGTLMNAGADTPGLAAAQSRHPGHFLAMAGTSLRLTKKTADMAVFTVHWGKNYRSEPSQGQRDLARQTLDLGYDVFIAHSAHQFLGVELHEGKPIIHDAGNFVVDFSPKKKYWNARNMVFVLHYEGTRLKLIEAIPIYREGVVTSFAKGAIAEEICERFANMSRELGTAVDCTADHRALILVDWDRTPQ
jgi:poly-gamma-glutamate synthesis protein (capsule biosynthesis protein)